MTVTRFDYVYRSSNKPVSIIALLFSSSWFIISDISIISIHAVEVKLHPLQPLAFVNSISMVDYHNQFIKSGLETGDGVIAKIQSYRLSLTTQWLLFKSWLKYVFTGFLSIYLLLDYYLLLKNSTYNVYLFFNFKNNTSTV